MSVGWLVSRLVCLSVTHSFDDPHVAPFGLLGLVELRAVFALLLLPNRPRLDCRVSGLVFNEWEGKKKTELWP